MNQPLLVIDYIVSWLDSYAKKVGECGFVVGISGGIDSALTSTLCAKTGRKTILLNLPIRQHPSEYARGSAHINWLAKNYPNCIPMEVDLSTTFSVLEQSLPLDTKTNLLAMANTRSRLRMTTLYAIAQAHGCLVAGTGNKIEDFGVGFFTKYGDGGVDLSPIADLTKSEVRALASELGVDSEILKAAPTDGLWGDERTDEDQLGATYPELEWAMDFQGSDSELTERQLEVLQIYRKFNTANKHKMVPIPVCSLPAHLK